MVIVLSAAVSSVFDPPEGKAPFSIVFDFTGDIHSWTDTVWTHTVTAVIVVID